MFAELSDPEFERQESNKRSTRLEWVRKPERYLTDDERAIGLARVEELRQLLADRRAERQQMTGGAS